MPSVHAGKINDPTKTKTKTKTLEMSKSTLGQPTLIILVDIIDVRPPLKSET